LTEALFVLDAEYRFTHVNHEACRLLNCTPDELLEACLWCEDFASFGYSHREKYEQAMLLQKVDVFTTFCYDLVWLEFRIYPSTDGLTVMFRDVTTEKREQLTTEQHYRSLFENHPDAISCLDREGNFSLLNPSNEPLTGYTLDEIMARTFHDFIHPADVKKFEQHYSKTLQGIPQKFEERIINKAGETLVLQITCVPINVNDEVVGVYAIAQNITDQKRTEDALRFSERMLKESQRVAQIGCWEYHFNKRASFWSEETFRIFGMEPSPGLVKFDHFKRFIHPEDLPKTEEMIQRAASGERVELEYRIVLPDGTERYVLSQRSLNDRGNPAESMFGVIQDITERKRTEELLRKSDKLSAVGQLAAAVAHEIRNPLTSVKGFIKLLKTSGTGTANAERYIDIVMNELDRIEWITSELLMLSKPQATRFTVLNICTILESVSLLLSSEALMRNIEIAVNCEASNMSVFGESMQLKQVFMNILKNSIEAMEDGGRIEVRASRANEKEVVVDIIDEGTGILPERIPKLGEPFYTTKEKGTGLGLMVTHRIVEAHLGSIRIASEYGKGTKVTVILPLHG
jgi:two-component system, sporulation sensor kinase A